MHPYGLNATKGHMAYIKTDKPRIYQMGEKIGNLTVVRIGYMEVEFSDGTILVKQCKKILRSFKLFFEK